MSLKRRDFINITALAAATGIIPGLGSNNAGANNTSSDKMHAMLADVVPITVEERKARVEKAQRLLNEQKIEALILDSGTSLIYFTGISWWPSERPMVAIIPARGEVSYVCPAFEEDRLRELI